MYSEPVIIAKQHLTGWSWYWHKAESCIILEWFIFR